MARSVDRSAKGLRAAAAEVQRRASRRMRIHEQNDALSGARIRGRQIDRCVAIDGRSRPIRASTGCENQRHASAGHRAVAVNAEGAAIKIINSRIERQRGARVDRDAIAIDAGVQLRTGLHLHVRVRAPVNDGSN